MPRNLEQSLSKNYLAKYGHMGELIIPYVELTVSAQCTLNCKDCANFMQYYEKPDPMDLDTVLAWTKSFLDAVDYVIMFRVMGGEALMQKGVHHVLEFLIDHPKVQLVALVSNATIIPGADVIRVMKNPKASIYLSNYGSRLAPKYKTIVDKCIDESILVKISDADMAWSDFGDTAVRTTDIEVMKQIYRRCGMPCKHIWNGEFHVCPRSAHGRALGMIKMKDSDFVKLSGTSVEERREQIRALYNLDYIDACACCGIVGAKKIAAGLQGKTIKYKMVAL